MLKNKFITFEGIDGCGKTTQSELLSQHLIALGEPVVVTSELHGQAFYKTAKDLLMDYNIEPFTETLLLMAIRYEHAQKVILPAMSINKKWVICDRFVDSTACYQGQYRDIGIDTVYKLHKDLIYGFMPDITFFLDLNIETSVKFTQIRDRLGPHEYISGKKIKDYENKSIKMYKRIRDHFIQLLDRFPDRMVRIDANGLSADEVHAKVLEVLTERKLI